jgi:hypothetical protein
LAKRWRGFSPASLPLYKQKNLNSLMNVEVQVNFELQIFCLFNSQSEIRNPQLKNPTAEEAMLNAEG